MFCEKCSKEIKDDVRFCPYCGLKINITTLTWIDKKSIKNNSVKPLNVSKKKSKKGLLIILCSLLVVIVVIVSAVLINSILNQSTNNMSQTDASSSNNKSITPENSNIPKSSDKYDEVIVSGGGYNIVRKHVESYDSSFDEYGIITDSGDWTTEMSGTNYIASAVQSLMSDGYIESYYTPEFYYLGESMLATCCSCAVLGVTDIPNGYFQSYEMHGACQVINPEKKITFGTGGYLISEYRNGYTFTKAGNAGSVIRYDKEGSNKMFVQATNDIYIGEASCGLIYVDKKFYDVESAEVKIDLSEYDMEIDLFETTTNGGRLSFEENGECYFEFFNPSKNRYGATINTKGEFIGEPQLIE